MFDEIVVCSGCGKKMQRIDLIKNGFRLRALQCDKCEKRIVHPADIEEYKRFSQLKQTPFAVKLRMVGNSYTVSIPREIVDFMNEQDGMHQRVMKMQNEMVRVFFEEFGKISLTFAQPQQKEAVQEEDEKINLKNKKLKVVN